MAPSSCGTWPHRAKTQPKKRTLCRIYAPWQVGPSPARSGPDTCHMAWRTKGFAPERHAHSSASMSRPVAYVITSITPRPSAPHDADRAWYCENNTTATSSPRPARHKRTAQPAAPVGGQPSAPGRAAGEASEPRKHPLGRIGRRSGRGRRRARPARQPPARATRRSPCSGTARTAKLTTNLPPITPVIRVLSAGKR